MASSWQEQFDVTCREIKRLYNDAIEPLEEKTQYESFRPSWFSETLKPCKPFILFVGPFSSGKSTFINYLLGHDYLWTGPQPTTDKFTVVMHGPEVNNISGRILASNNDLPFRGLSDFGHQFLEAFSGMQCPCELLKNVTLIDTPGILESAKDIHSRNYDYIKVMKWLIDRSDLVFVMFDPSKLDAGIELRSLFAQMKGNESKLRMVLNKADQCGPQELMRVYGSLFWNLSNLVTTTEPPRVYVSSFWNRPYRTPQNQELFDEEKADLMYDVLEVVPLQCLDKRVTAVMRRALDVQIHTHTVATMREKLPSMIGKSKAKKDMLANMDKIFEEVALKYKLTRLDFPTQDEYREFFDKANVSLSDMPTIKDIEKAAKKGQEHALKKLERIIRFDLPKLLQPLAQAAAIDPRKARKEKQGAGAPPDKNVYVNQVTEQQRIQQEAFGGQQGGMMQQQPMQGMQQQPMQQPMMQQQGMQPMQQQGMQGMQQQPMQQPMQQQGMQQMQQGMQNMTMQPTGGYQAQQPTGGYQGMMPMQGQPMQQSMQQPMQQQGMMQPMQQQSMQQPMQQQGMMQMQGQPMQQQGMMPMQGQPMQQQVSPQQSMAYVQPQQGMNPSPQQSMAYAQPQQPMQTMAPMQPMPQTSSPQTVSPQQSNTYVQQMQPQQPMDPQQGTQVPMAQQQQEAPPSTYAEQPQQ